MHKELADNIRSVYSGRKVMAPEAAAQLAQHNGEEALTPKEIEVLRLIAAGNANKEIAAQLSTSEETVKSRVKNIFDKLGANDRTHAVTIGLKRGIIEL
jgi:DNA-binding NarL/FixJ family response regulator